MAKVLVVDDEKSIRLTLQAFLEDDGHDVSVAAHADEALERLAETPRDIVLSDIVLPRVNGLDLLRKIREMWPQTLVIMMTGEPTVETASEALRLGAFDYLMKPIRKAAVLRVVTLADETKALADRNRHLEEENLRYQSVLEDIVQQRTAELRLLYEAAREMASTLDPQRAIQALFSTLRDAIPFTGATVATYVPEAGELRCAATAGADGVAYTVSADPAHIDTDARDALSLAVLSGEPVVLNHCGTVAHLPEGLWQIEEIGALWRTDSDADSLGSTVVVPLRAGGRVTGAVQVYHHEPNTYTADHVRVLDALASHLGASLVNATLYGQSQAEVALRRKAEQELRALNLELDAKVAARTRQLEEANRELDSFAYSVSHDLRAPLRAITGFIDILLQEHKLSDAELALVDRVRGNAANMDQMVQELLRFSRLAQRDLNTTKVSVRRLATEVLADEIAGQADRNIHTIVGDVPDCSADPFLLRIVLANLIANAVKYTRRTECAEIEIGATDEEGSVAYYVRDNGCGFDMRYADRLFRVFQRLHAEHEYEGSGVGLAIVHRIVRRHGGRVWAESRPGEGTTIRFIIEPPAAA